MAETNDNPKPTAAEIDAMEREIKADAKGNRHLLAYNARKAAEELCAKWYRHKAETGTELDPRRLIRAGEEHLADEARRLARVSKKSDDADSDDDDKPEAKPAKKPAAKKPPTPEEHRRNVASRFAAAAWKEQERKKTEDAKPTKRETPEQRRNRIAKSVLQYRVPAKKKAS